MPQVVVVVPAAPNAETSTKRMGQNKRE